MRIRQGLHFAKHDLNVCKVERTGSGALFLGTILAIPVPV